MDTRTTASPHLTDASDVAMQPQQEPDKISAYYSLVFPNFTYYLQTLSVTIGRRCIPPTTGSSADVAQIDVDLGPLKSVSRLHAKIEYEEEEERFVLVVIGRNGAWVDGVWSPSGNRVSLSERYAVNGLLLVPHRARFSCQSGHISRLPHERFSSYYRRRLPQKTLLLRARIRP